MSLGLSFKKLKLWSARRRRRLLTDFGEKDKLLSTFGKKLGRLCLDDTICA